MVERIQVSTAWHIIFGTYGDRLHGDPRMTVDRTRNEWGDEYVATHERRQIDSYERMNAEPLVLSAAQRSHIEHTMPAICARGGWSLLECAAQPNHVHVVVEADSAIHGKGIRKWMKRWLGESLDTVFPRREAPLWWAEGGSTKAISDGEYRANALRYVREQRFTGNERDPVT